MVTRHAFGGEVSTQAGIYTLTALVVVSAGLGYYNIKRLQIEQHRKWMIRKCFSVSDTEGKLTSILTHYRYVGLLRHHYNYSDSDDHHGTPCMSCRGALRRILYYGEL
jgi:hypothetical protein